MNTVELRTGHRKRRRRRKDKRALTRGSFPAAWFDLNSTTTSRIHVDEESSLAFTAVWAAVRILAETMASLPLQVFSRQPDGAKDRVYKSPLLTLLDNPNQHMTYFVWRETMQGYLSLWGNALSEIERSATNQPIALWPRDPDRITPEVSTDGTEFWYRYQPHTGGQRIILPADMVHIVSFGTTGLWGLSPIRKAASEAVGVGIAAEQFAGAFFGNNATLGTVLTHPGKLKDTAQKNLLNSLNTYHGTSSNAFKAIILEEGMKAETLTMPLKDAEFIALRKFQIAEVARIFRIPLHLIGDLDRSTNNNIEWQGMDFVRHTIRPLAERWEAELLRKLFGGTNLFPEFNLDALMRADIEARFGSYATGIEHGIYSPNEVRRLENRDPYEGGDDRYIPMNVRRIGDPMPVPAAPPAPAPVQDDSRERIRERLTTLASGAIARMIRKECKAMRAAFKKHGDDPDALRDAVLTFYGNCTTEVAETIGEAVTAVGVVSGCETTPADVAGRYVAYRRALFVNSVKVPLSFELLALKVPNKLDVADLCDAFARTLLPGVN